MGMCRTFLITGAVLLGGLAVTPSALAQQAAGPKIQVAATAAAAAKAKAVVEGNKWTCASGRSFEIAPVSSDVETNRAAFVVIHLRNGEPVSSERITAAEAAALREAACKDELDGADGAFVGG